MTERPGAQATGVINNSDRMTTIVIRIMPASVTALFHALACALAF